MTLQSDLSGVRSGDDGRLFCTQLYKVLEKGINHHLRKQIQVNLIA